MMKVAHIIYIITKQNVLLGVISTWIAQKSFFLYDDTFFQEQTDFQIHCIAHYWNS